MNGYSTRITESHASDSSPMTIESAHPCQTIRPPTAASNGRTPRRQRVLGPAVGFREAEEVEHHDRRPGIAGGEGVDLILGGCEVRR